MHVASGRGCLTSLHSRQRNGRIVIVWDRIESKMFVSIYVRGLYGMIFGIGHIPNVIRVMVGGGGR